jgi:hypothetical protein
MGILDYRDGAGINAQGNIFYKLVQILAYADDYSHPRMHTRSDKNFFF